MFSCFACGTLALFSEGLFEGSIFAGWGAGHPASSSDVPESPPPTAARPLASHPASLWISPQSGKNRCSEKRDGKDGAVPRALSLWLGGGVLILVSVMGDTAPPSQTAVGWPSYREEDLDRTTSRVYPNFSTTLSKTRCLSTLLRCL